MQVFENLDKKGKFVRKRGRKAKFLQKAKKFGKQGKLGKGFEIDGETYSYFLRVLEIWKKNEFEGDEERDDFVQNSFSQTEGNEVNYSSNQMTSRVIETLLPFANEHVLTRFTNAFTLSLRTICTDPFASHVLEKLLEISSCDKWRISQLGEWFRQTSMFVINNLEEFVFGPYANHILRKICECLTGFVQESGQKTIPNPNQEYSFRKPEECYIYGQRQKCEKNEEIFSTFYSRFLQWPQFFDLFQTELTSALVQTVLKTCAKLDPEVLSKSKTKSLEDGILQVVKALGNELDLGKEVHAKLYTRMLEVCLSLSNKTWDNIFQTYFKGRLIEFGVHEKGKFSLKRIIETCPTKVEFEAIFDEIQDGLATLYEAESYSIFASLAAACNKFQTRQSQFMQSIEQVLPEEKDSFIMRVARFGGKIELKEDLTPKYLTQFVGTVILQNALEFHKPQKLISLMLEMDGASLSKLAMDPKGSHIFDAYFKSGTIGEKNKDKLLNRMKEYLVTLSMNKFGSRVINTVWSWASLKNRTLIAASLSERIPQLNANQFGKFISKKCALHAYKRDPKVWGEAIQKMDKRKKEAEDVLSTLLDEPEAPPTKKKKQRHQEQEELLLENEEPKRKKKKRKHSKSDPEEQDFSAEIEPEDSQPSKHKKKKKRNHEDQHEESEQQTTDINQFDVNPQDQDQSKKKKKKKQRIETDND